MQSKKTILVTGANGQLGNEMRLLGGLSNNNYIYTDIAELNITDPEAVGRMVADNNVKVIINCAAYTNVDKAEDDTQLCALINTKAPEILAAVAKQQSALLIHVSTDYVFQGEGNKPCVESDPTNPIGVYGRTKLDGELAIQNSGCDYLIFRTAWLYSTFGNNFVKTMLKLTAERDSIKVVFDQVGTPTYAADLARTIFEIVENDTYQGNTGIYHYSNLGVCSWFDFAHEIANLAQNRGCDLQPCYSSEFPSKVKRPSFSVLDKAKITQTFNISIPYWRDSLIVCLNKMTL